MLLYVQLNYSGTLHRHADTCLWSGSYACFVLVLLPVTALHPWMYLAFFVMMTLSIYSHSVLVNFGKVAIASCIFLACVALYKRRPVLSLSFKKDYNTWTISLCLIRKRESLKIIRDPTDSSPLLLTNKFVRCITYTCMYSPDFLSQNLKGSYF